VAAQTLYRSQFWLGQHYRRMRTRLGAPKAITAAAHKLARIVFHLLTTPPYDESVFAQQEFQNHQHIQQKLRTCRLGGDITSKLLVRTNCRQPLPQPAPGNASATPCRLYLSLSLLT
jgi:hypothetical protein